MQSMIILQIRLWYQKNVFEYVKNNASVYDGLCHKPKRFQVNSAIFGVVR